MGPGLNGKAVIHDDGQDACHYLFHSIEPILIFEPFAKLEIGAAGVFPYYETVLRIQRTIDILGVHIFAIGACSDIRGLTIEEHRIGVQRKGHFQYTAGFKTTGSSCIHHAGKVVDFVGRLIRF